jgi:SAM-dependent methyltransferase
MSDRLKVKMNELAQRVRPWLPFTALNTVYRRINRDTRSLLDVGCGQGGPARFINRRRRYYTVGVDIFKPYLAECQRQRLHNDYIQCDVRSLPFRDRSFDTVICMEVLEHLDRPDGEVMLRAMERIARRQVILSTPMGRYRQEAYDGNPHQEHKHIWTPAEMRGLGYLVRPLGLRDIGGHGGIRARLPGFLGPLGDLLWVLAGPLVRLFPSLGGNMVCWKQAVWPPSTLKIAGDKLTASVR